ncbi:MAG: EAL domain-containing protein [Spirochaetota bacterium]
MFTNFVSNKKNIRKRNYLYSVIIGLFIILFFTPVCLYVYHLRHFNQFYKTLKEKELVRLTDVAFSACSPVIDQHLSGCITTNIAVQQLVEIICRMRYRDGTHSNYIFLLKKNGTLLANPVSCKYNDTDLINKKDDDDEKKYFINKIIQTATANEKGGFVYYRFRPGKDSEGEKISYVRVIPSLDCIIGTGLYVDRADKEIKPQFSQRVIGAGIAMSLVVILASISLYYMRKNLKLLQINENRLRTMFNNIDYMVALLDSGLRIVELNNAANSFIGDAATSFEGSLFEDLPIWTDIHGSRDILIKAIKEVKNGMKNRYHIISRNSKGEDRNIHFSIYPLDKEGKESSLFIAEGKDITDLKEKEEKIYQYAFFDKITELPNERLFAQIVSGLLKSGDQDGALLAAIRISDLSFISSVLGFEAGNEMLRSFSKRLAFFSDSGCIVSKFSGSIFSIYIPPDVMLSQEKEIYASFSELCSYDSRPLVFYNHEMRVNVLIGASKYPEHGSGYDELLRNAMIAMDNSKSYPTRRFEIFNQYTSEKVHRKAMIEEALGSPGLEDTLFVHFQPQVDFKSGNIMGFEALARWTDKKLGSVSPADFIPIAEKTGAINKIFDCVLNASAALISEIGYSGGWHVSVNVSPIQFMDDALQNMLSSAISKYNISPSAIAIEITESTLLESFDSTIQILHLLRSNGYLISLDDFGTGYSSLSYLRSLPIDILKLDKSFILGIDCDEKSVSIVGSIINIAHNLGIKVIAEGVETKEQAALLKGINCDLSQGWYTGKPMEMQKALEIGMNSIITVR